jgi:hypothetical protein
MRERPILFSSPMVRRILANQKTQTRRVVTMREFQRSTTPGYDFTFRDRRAFWNDYRLADLLRSKWNPYGAPGDRLWVRETHAQFAVGNRTGISPQCVAYRATCDADGGFEYVNNGDEVMRLKVTKWTPAIHMPRWASRLLLEVTAVRVERLQDISPADACAEGAAELLDPSHPLRATVFRDHGKWAGNDRIDQDGKQAGAVDAFATLWDSINGRRAPWASNPWCWVLSFRRIEPEAKAA